MLLFALREKVVEPANRLIFMYFFVALAFKIDGRVPVGGAIALLAASAVALITEEEEFANELAISAYYLLGIGVGTMLVEYVREGGEPERRIPGEAPGAAETRLQQEVPMRGGGYRPQVYRHSQR